MAKIGAGKMLRTTHATTFGEMVEFSRAEIPTQLIVVCTNRGGGWVPRAVLLSHQLYTEKISEWLEEDPHINEVVAFPLAHDAYVEVWKR